MPQVIALDDWQWVDDSSAELLEHLLALTARVPLLFVIAGRPAEHGAVASLARALANEGVVPIGRHCELVLEPLPEVGARQLVSDLLQGGTLPSRLQERLT